MISKVSFATRRQNAWLVGMKILRLLSSGAGFPLLVGITGILLTIAYAQLLEGLPAHFPLEFVVALFCSVIITFHPIRTWIQKPDIVFLLPMEPQLQPYIRACYRYNVTLQTLGWIVFFVLLAPFYQTYIGSMLSFMMTALWVYGLQLLYTYTTWQRLKRDSLWIHGGLFVINFLFLFSLFSGQWIMASLLWIGLILIFLIRYRSIPLLPWPWEKFIQREQKAEQSYITLASWFVDIPQKETAIKPRKILVWICSLFQPRARSLSYLYWRRFLRDGEYLYTYLRIVVFSIVLMFVSPHPIMLIAIYLFSLGLFLLQLPALGNPHQYPIWIRIYPHLPKQGLTSVGLTLIGIQTTILSIMVYVITFDPWFASGLYALGWVINFLYSVFYLPWKQKKTHG